MFASLFSYLIIINPPPLHTRASPQTDQPTCLLPIQDLPLVPPPPTILISSAAHAANTVLRRRQPCIIFRVNSFDRRFNRRNTFVTSSGHGGVPMLPSSSTSIPPSLFIYLYLTHTHRWIGLRSCLSLMSLEHHIC